MHPEPRIAKGRSRSVTYPEDLTDPAEIRDKVVGLAEEVADEVLADGRVVERVAVTVRTRTFYTRTRSRTVSPPSTDVGEIVAAALVASTGSNSTGRCGCWGYGWSWWTR